MKYKLKMVTLIVMLIASVMLTGCIGDDKKIPINKIKDNEILVISYLDNKSILTKSDFPDFELIKHQYAIASENMSVTINTESSHRVLVMDADEEVPKGFRIYGSSESYNSSKNSTDMNKTLGKNMTDRYLFLQYKAFDDNSRLDYLLNMTAGSYAKNGYKSKVLGNDTNITYKGRVFMFESTNSAGLNRTIILFGHDNVIGTIGVQDSEDRSLNESLKILDIVSDRLNVNTKEVKIVKSEIIRSFNNTDDNKSVVDNSNITVNQS